MQRPIKFDEVIAVAAHKRLVIMVSCVALMGGLCLTSAQTDELTARDWFYSAKDMVAKPKPKPTAHAPQPKPKPAEKPPLKFVTNSSLGLRYSVLKKELSGSYSEVRPDSEFRAGDKIRLSVTSNARGYLYIVQQGSSGNWTPLFPSAEINGGQNLVEPGRVYHIPGGKGEDFELDERAGVERIFILLTRRPENDLDKIVLSLRGAHGAASFQGPLIDDSLVQQFRDRVQSRDLIFTKSEEDRTEKKDEAVYVVNTNPDSKPDPRVVVDVKLTHQ